MCIVRTLLICLICCSQFLQAESSSFRGCNDPVACNYGLDDDCVYPSLGECCEGFDVSIQSIKDINEFQTSQLMPGQIIKVAIRAF